MDDVSTVVSVVSGLVTIVSGLIGLIKWSDRHSPHTKTKLSEQGAVDAGDWISVMFSAGLGLMAFIISSQAFGLTVVAAALLGLAVAAVFWMFWWFAPL
ncbi:hypothetical protein ACFYV7_24905 [Nocardia suismassiliense]|uniref:Uncharacterized protein n=1 Tax=Nocardia suismassiliense TaxID=2077092 RepID=A0ABW6QXS3_9NOCA